MPESAFPPSDRMKRITKEEIAGYKTRLSSWLKLGQVDVIMQEIGQTAQLYTVSQGGLKFWREAFVGMSCAYLTHAQRFRLGADPPDFELDYGDKVQGFELLQVMPKGWRLGSEYDTYADELNRFGRTKFKSRSHKEGQKESESVVEDVKEKLATKLSRGYDPSIILVIDILHDLNLHLDLGHAKALTRVARSASKSFAEVWLRQSNNLLRVSPHSASLISQPWLSDN